jgi:hypothetical protein
MASSKKKNKWTNQVQRARRAGLPPKDGDRRARALMSRQVKDAIARKRLEQASPLDFLPEADVETGDDEE